MGGSSANLGSNGQPPEPLPTTKYDPLFAAWGRATGIDPMVLKATAWVESTLNPNSVNTYTDPRTGKSVDHDGLMQLSAENEKTYHVTDPFNPDQNIMGGASLLRDNLEMNGYNGDLAKALKAYFAGVIQKNWGHYAQGYVDKVDQKYRQLTGQPLPKTILINGKTNDLGYPIAFSEPDTNPGANLGGAKIDARGNVVDAPRPDDVPTLRPAPRPTPGAVNTEDLTHPIAQPEHAPGPSPASQPPGHLNMNNGPPGQTNFGQNQPDPLTMALLSPPVAGQPHAQLAFAPTTRRPVPARLPSSLPPSPFVQALLTNAIFGGGSRANPFATAAGILPGGTGWR